MARCSWPPNYSVLVLFAAVHFKKMQIRAISKLAFYYAYTILKNNRSITLYHIQSILHIYHKNDTNDKTTEMD
jgi:hypothetical protein